MPCGKVHTAFGVGVGLLTFFMLDDEPQQDNSKKLLDAVLMVTAGTIGGKLPDILEPATSPNHRDFFHSWLVLAGTGCLAYKLYNWKPSEAVQKTLRKVLLSLIAGYSSHLLLDARTPKSLPLI